MDEKRGPFKLLDTHNSNCENQVDPLRKYECDHYTTCLSLAAALDWDNFHCTECIGQVDNQLLWQARKLEKQDKLVGKICNFEEDVVITPNVANIK